MTLNWTIESMLQNLLSHVAWTTQPAIFVFVATFADEGFAVPALTFTTEQEFKWLQAMYTERLAIRTGKSADFSLHPLSICLSEDLCNVHLNCERAGFQVVNSNLVCVIPPLLKCT